MNEALLLPDDELDPELAALAHRMRFFAEQELGPHARTVDEERRFRREGVAAMAAVDLLRGPLPTAVGGAGWSPMELVVAHEEIGAVCGSSRGFLAVQTGLVAHLFASRASDEQRGRWLPGLMDGTAIGCFGLTEPEAGSDVAALRTRAERTGSGYRLHGEKVWITNGGVADVALVFANADPDRGREGITAFVVPTDTPGFRREPVEGVELGHRGSDHARLLLEGVEVPGDAVLGGAEGAGRGFRDAMEGLEAGRLSVAAGAVGLHRAALHAALAFTTRRRQFGRALASFQMVQERLADLAVELHAARALVYRCARRRAADREGPFDLAAAKLYATEAASRAAEQAVLLHGGRGYSSAYPVERLQRDAMGLRIYEGTSMIQKLILARALTAD